MKRYSFYLFLLAFSFILTTAYAGSQTLTTYYPAPQGNYLNMSVNGQLTVGGEETFGVTAACSQSGNTVSMANVGGQLEICDSSGPYFLTNTTLWKKGATSYIYPTSTGESVAIGSPLDPGVAAGVRLGVTGGSELINGGGAANIDLTVSGRIRTGDGANDGGMWVDNTGGLFVGNAAGDIGFWTAGQWSLLVSPGGNVGIGPNVSAPTSTLYVQGTANVTGNTAVEGYTTLSGGAGVSGGLTLASSNAANPTSLQYCNASMGNCAPLEVGLGSDTNYYAVYGP